jgi:hypothetical protein
MCTSASVTQATGEKCCSSSQLEQQQHWCQQCLAPTAELIHTAAIALNGDEGIQLLIQEHVTNVSLTHQRTTVPQGGLFQPGMIGSSS